MDKKDIQQKTHSHHKARLKVIRQLNLLLKKRNWEIKMNQNITTNNEGRKEVAVPNYKNKNYTSRKTQNIKIPPYSPSRCVMSFIG